MNRKVLIKPLAEADLVEIQNWYDVESFGLGKQFLIAFSQALLLARNNPFHFQVRYMRLVRMVRTPGFPYCIHFVAETDRIVVLAVLHNKRNPRIWKTRMK